MMKRAYSIVLIALASFSFLAIAEISDGREFFVKDEAKTLEGTKYVPSEFLVKFKPGVSDRVVADINMKHGSSVLSTSRFAGFKRLKVPWRKTVVQMVEIYKRNPNVEYAEPNFIAHAFWVPNDPLYGYQWNMSQIKMEQAWEITSGGPGVVVAVIDTGVAYEDYDEYVDNPGRGKDYWITYRQAPDLISTEFVSGWDFVNDDSHPNDDEGHGTHVTGTIAQSTNNGIGVAGVACKASIMPIKVLNSSGSGTYADIADGIYYAAQHGANVINMSLGGSSGSITLENALDFAHNAGVTIVCSSGNDGSTTTVSYPAAYDAYCIAVGATRYDEMVAYYSNGGASLDLTAPGGDTTVDQNGDGYGDGVLQQTFGSDPTDFGYWFYQGTSMAAPHVSGVAALLIARGVAETPDQVREVLQATAKDKGATGWDPEYGWGIVDAFAALNYSSAPNGSPLADPGGPYSGKEDDPISFDGSGSSDPDGDRLTYRWNFGDGSTGAGITPTHTYSAGGTYEVTLIVNDGREDSAPSITSAKIEEVNDAPIADAGPDQEALVGDGVSFDGSNSYDPDGDPLTYMWDFGDGLTGSGVTQSHEYSSPGVYTVSLTVTDSGSPPQTAEDTATVTISEGTISLMHVVSIDMDLDFKTAGKNTFTNAHATVNIADSNGVPVEGATVHGYWSGVTYDIDSGITGADGKVTLLSDQVKNAPIGTVFTFTVDGISKAGWGYDIDSSVINNSITLQ
jgi:serine protease